MSTFSTKEYVELYSMLLNIHKMHTGNTDIILSTQYCIEIRRNMIGVYLRDKTGIERDVIRLIDTVESTANLGQHSSISSGTVYYTPSCNDISLKRNIIDLIYIDDDNLDEVEFQQSTLHDCGSLFTFLSYIHSKGDQYFMFSSYIDVPDVLHSALNDLRVYYATRRKVD